MHGYNLTVNDVLTVGASGTLQLYGSETLTATTKTLSAGSTVKFTGDGDSLADTYTVTGYFSGSYKNLTIASTDGTTDIFQSSGTLTVAEAFTINSSSLYNLNGQTLVNTSGSFVNNGTLRLRGSETITNLTQDTDSGTWEYTGDGDSAADTYTIKDFGATDYYHLTINATDGAIDIFQLGATLTVAGNLTNTAGTLDVTASNFGLTVGGNWAQSGTGALNARAGTVTFNNAGLTSMITGTTTFFNFTCQTASKALTLEAGATQTIGGTWTLDGQGVGTRVLLRSTISGTRAKVAPQGARAIQFVDVRDNHNLVLPSIVPAGSANSGNNINWFNSAPVASDEGYTVNEDTTLNVAAAGVLGNDTDAQADPLTAVLVSGPGQAQTFALNADGSFSYRAAANFNGADSFTYKANDGSLDSNVATVTITVTAVNDAPSFTKGANQTVLEDAGAQTVAGWATALSAGPVDESGQALDFIVSNDNNPLFSVQPAIAANGTLTYTPAANANGLATVTVQIHDNGGTANSGVDTSASQTFTITVTAVNDAPSFTKGANQTVLEDAGAQTVAGWATALSAGPADESGQALDFIVSNDNNPLFSAQPAVAANGTLTYTPAANANGLATVTVQIHDNGGTANSGVDTSASQTFTITVTAVNDAPVAAADAYSTNEDTPLNVAAPSVFANDSDLDGDPLTAVLVTNVTHGTLTLSADGSFTYTPAANYHGGDSFSYKANDGGLDSNIVAVMLTINSVDDAPVAVDDAYTATGGTALDTPALTGVLVNDSDADGHALTAVLLSGTSNGIVVLNADGSFTYTPSAGFSGTDTFFYQASDGTLLSNIATVTLSVTAGGGPGNPDDPSSDPDHDGFTNGEEAVGGTDPHDPDSHPMRMSVAMLKGIARFNTSDHDAWLVQAMLPDLPQDFDPTGAEVTIDCGGAKKSLTLDATGWSKKAGMRARLSLQHGTAQDTPLQIRVTRGNWSGDWLDEGVNPEVSVKNATICFIVALRLPGRAYVATAPTTYTSKAHAGGRFNLKKH